MNIKIIVIPIIILSAVVFASLISMSVAKKEISVAESRKHICETKRPLKALNIVKELGGSMNFIMIAGFGGGNGRLKEALKYKFFVKSMYSEGYLLKEINANNAIIYEDETINPYASSCNVECGLEDYCSDDLSWSIHIPAKSIVNEYDISLKQLK